MKMLNIPYFIIGPCSLESLEQMRPIVQLANTWGLSFIRAPLFKPRTHPDSFQGLGEEGLSILSELQSGQKLLNLPPLNFVSEVCSEAQLDLILPHVGVIQVGARNMQNFELLKSIGRKIRNQGSSAQVLLKRGFSNSLEEWLGAALYLERYGVPKEKIILCERGSRGAASPTGVSLDLGLALLAKQRSSYQVIVDPSHGTKMSSLVLPMTRASLTLPLDGVMIEVHPNPKESVSDPYQAISPGELNEFLTSL